MNIYTVRDILFMSNFILYKKYIVILFYYFVAYWSISILYIIYYARSWFHTWWVLFIIGQTHEFCTKIHRMGIDSSEN